MFDGRNYKKKKGFRYIFPVPTTTAHKAQAAAALTCLDVKILQRTPLLFTELSYNTPRTRWESETVCLVVYCLPIHVYLISIKPEEEEK